MEENKYKLEEIEHRLCISLMESIVADKIDYPNKPYYSVGYPLSDTFDVNLTAVDSQNNIPYEVCMAIRDCQRMYTGAYSWKTNNPVKKCQDGTTFNSNRYTFMFFEFMFTYNHETKKFKLKDKLMSKDDVFELVYDTKNYVTRNYPNNEYYDEYLVFTNIYMDKKALDSILGSKFATRVFSNKEDLYMLEQRIKNIKDDHEKNSKIESSQYIFDTLVKYMGSGGYGYYEASPEYKQIAELKLKIHVLSIMLRDEKLKNQCP